MSIPYIYRKDNTSVVILGEPDNLVALGEMLILKGKMNTRFSATMKDKDNNTIEILTGNELEGYKGGKR